MDESERAAAVPTMPAHLRACSRAGSSAGSLGVWMKVFIHTPKLSGTGLSSRFYQAILTH